MNDNGTLVEVLPEARHGDVRSRSKHLGMLVGRILPRTPSVR